MRPVAFRVDADELADVVGELARCGDRLEDLAADVERRASALHGTWTGAAAVAHAAAQQEWDAGFARMRAALADLRDAGDRAHAHYTAAARTNLYLWAPLH